ncbi:DUF1499 domain-containing protein [Devosia sediminis]|uniref:DUF1499 domain-containing protein n=1 Tax=Devosia sediminis TaxID=2798801 RepID=A0A934IYW5_9HYPH|nr:DUF1499 domain-containing protein [Devosia sediminis]MBJ3784760.1 DUF1499 domain-containing protein [Devosia sediminis]
MRILIRTSKWATVARRLGWLAVPLTLVPVIMHHGGFLDSRTFLSVAAFACLVAALAVLTALIALARLWQTGDQGWGRALAGLFLGLVCLAPFAWYGSLALRNPVVTDISTVPRGELPLIFEPDTALMPPSQMLTPEEQQFYFPNATTRTYPLDALQLFAIVEHLAEEQGWDIRQRNEPGADGEPGRINARIVTLPGWREEAVLRVMPTPGGGAVDMRSASIGAPHDLGSNGERISSFLVALDDEVTAFLRDNPNINQPVAPEPEEPAPEVETGG